ncbi:MAG: outer membrane protein assembly factor BamC [Burkholderiaceae bacterium]
MTRSLSFIAAPLALALVLSGCSSIENLMSGDKIDYRSTGNKTNGLEVPPDLTQLARDTRYGQQGGSVSASTFQAPLPAGGVAVVQSVAPQALGDIRLERAGSQRWLTTPLTAEQLWPQLQSFWADRGFNLVVNQANAGVMETEWAENRAKLPQDFIRATVGRVFDSLYSTGERDKFRTRVERTPNGTEVYITHRGMVEVYSDQLKQQTVWQPRPADPQLEAEFLSRLMVKLGAKEEVAKIAVATSVNTAPARARALANTPAASLQVDDSFERAWRRVGLALDRSGFTVEDRDRSQGVYFIRYVDPALAGKDEPGMLSKFFNFGSKTPDSGPARYRVVVKGEATTSTVTVQNATGAPENGEAGQRIVKLLVEDLK